MRILCLLPIYQRHDVTALTFAGLERLAKALKNELYELYVLVVASNQEDYNFADAWAKKCWGEWPEVFVMQTENLPLGRKFNAGLGKAIKYMDAYKIEWLMLSGCDNLFSDSIVEQINNKTFLPFENSLFGFTNVAMYNKATREAVEIVYPCASGVGRMHHINMLKRACDCHIAIAQRSLAGRFGNHTKGQTVYIPKWHTPDPSNYEIVGEAWHMWPDDTHSSTDIDSENWLLMSGYDCKYIKTPEPLILDIKTDDNISKWETFANNKQNRAISDFSGWPEIG